MSLNTTLYLDEESKIRQRIGLPKIAAHGRAFVTLDVDGLHFQADCWEHMQALVDALQAQIDNAKSVEADARIKAAGLVTA